MYRFGDLVIDPRARELVRGGEAIHLEPQAFDLLVHLIEHRDEVVSQHDLLDGVWGQRFVSEAAITTRIEEIRRAVGDDGATQHTISDVGGRGYRFVAELTSEASGSGAPVRRDPAPAADGPLGRHGELDEVVARLAAWPVVTLVGPGGVGKSTLARWVLRRIGEARGARHVELAPLTSGGDVLPALCRALDTVFEPERPDVAIATIARLDVVLGLDHCEHVVEHVAELVDRLLAVPGRTTRVLATSQLRLGVADEQVIGLTALTQDAAEALFVIRAGAIHPGWSVDDVGRDRLARLLDQLDRLPLAIEMVAARLASMTFDDLEAAVVHQGDGIQMTHRTPTRRHRTVGSLVEWSAELLAPEHRRVFVELSVFAGAITARDAAAVVGPVAGVALAELADRSLLAVDLDGTTARYRMLDTVQAVARRWLDESDTGAAVRGRHAAAIADALDLVDDALRGTDEPAARRRLDEIVDELRQAYRWAGEHDEELVERMSASLHVASCNRLWSEPGSWAAEVIARRDAGPAAGPDAGPLPATRSLVAGAAADAGRLDVAREHAIRVLADTRHARLLATAHDILADVALCAGRLDAAAHHATELERLGAELDDVHVAAIAAIDRSLLLTARADPAAGLAAVRRPNRSVLSRTDLAWIAYAEGEAFSHLGDRDRAVAAFGRAIDLAASVANTFVMSVARSALAAELARAGATRAAYEAYGVGLRSAIRRGNLVHAATMVRNLVTLLAGDGDHRSATVLAAALSAEAVRPSHGDESARLASVVAQVESEVWPDRFASWQAEGRALDLDAAVRRAIAIVDGHLR